MPNPASRTRLKVPAIVSTSCILGLLYAGRAILQPIALALILSLIVAPLIRALSHRGMRRVPATLTALLLVGACAAGIGAILTVQLVSVTTELPQYQTALRQKAGQLSAQAERPFTWMEANLHATEPSVPGAESGQPLTAAASRQPIPVEIRPTRPSTGDTLARLFSLVWGPIGETGLVLVLLLFILLEHDSLQDRLIRLAGQTETSRTVRALADAAQGVSRFFFSQFVVNAAFGLAIGLALWGLGIPHAVLVAPAEIGVQAGGQHLGQRQCAGHGSGPRFANHERRRAAHRLGMARFRGAHVRGFPLLLPVRPEREVERRVHGAPE